jgi:hypothetical protein
LARPPPSSAAWAVCLGAAPCGAGGGGERWGSRNCTRRGVARRAHVAQKTFLPLRRPTRRAEAHRWRGALGRGSLDPGRSSDRPRGGGPDDAPQTCRFNLLRHTTNPRAHDSSCIPTDVMNHKSRIAAQGLVIIETFVAMPTGPTTNAPKLRAARGATTLASHPAARHQRGARAQRRTRKPAARPRPARARAQANQKAA